MEEFVSCPICNEKMKNSELRLHCDIEISRFQQQIGGESNLINNPSKSEPQPNTILSDNTKPCSSGGTGTNTFSIYQKVRNNRNNRKAISRKRPTSNEPVCPVCNERPSENINVHVEKCLKNSSRGSDDDESIDIEGGAFEEYEWAGHKRIRVSSLLSGGYSSLGMGSSFRSVTSTDHEDEDEDLNVDGDDTVIYGPCQYQDSDVIAPSFVRDNREFGGAYTESNSSGGSEEEDPSDGNNTFREPPTKQQIQESTETIIKSLKSRIRDLENQTKNKIKCLICLDDFKDPAVSVCCWHVHCESCWLRTLGSRKLCPQCNLITSPTDLRRIYM